jgi:hypothetical protein
MLRRAPPSTLMLRVVDAAHSGGETTDALAARREWHPSEAVVIAVNPQRVRANSGP